MNAYIYQVQRYWADRDEWLIYTECNTQAEAEESVAFWTPVYDMPMRVKRVRI